MRETPIPTDAEKQLQLSLDQTIAWHHNRFHRLLSKLTPQLDLISDVPEHQHDWMDIATNVRHLLCLIAEREALEDLREDAKGLPF